MSNPKMPVLDRAEFEKRLLEMGTALAVVWTTIYILQQEDHSSDSRNKLLVQLLSLAKEANRLYRDLFGWDAYDLGYLRKKLSKPK